jgi:hypothetical protein
MNRWRARVSSSGLRLIIVTVAVSCMGVVLATARPTAPPAMPVLSFDRIEARRVAEADRLAAASPVDGEFATRMRELFREHNRQEADSALTTSERARIRERLLGLSRLLIEAQGLESLSGLRSEAIESSLRALAGELDRSERDASLGAFGPMLRRYQVVRGDERMAPELTIRTLLKSRWNQIHGLERMADFNAVELQAYWGWLALHANRSPTELRRSALASFEAAGGMVSHEMKARFELQAGNTEAAASLYEDIYIDTGNVRFRNHAIFSLLQGS